MATRRTKERVWRNRLRRFLRWDASRTSKRYPVVNDPYIASLAAAAEPPISMGGVCEMERIRISKKVRRAMRRRLRARKNVATAWEKRLAGVVIACP